MPNNFMRRDRVPQGPALRPEECEQVAPAPGSGLSIGLTTRRSDAALTVPS